MIATLDIRKARDSAGHDIVPSARFRPGFARCVTARAHVSYADELIGIYSQPEHFVADIRPRSQKAADLVLQMAAAA